MYCKCGGLCSESNYEVTTEKKAIEWLGLETESPIHVVSKTCKACGRMYARITDKNNKVLRDG